MRRWRSNTFLPILGMLLPLALGGCQIAEGVVETVDRKADQVNVQLQNVLEKAWHLPPKKEATYRPPPAYCYKTLGSVDCYERPLEHVGNRTVGAVEAPALPSSSGPTVIEIYPPAPEELAVEPHYDGIVRKDIPMPMARGRPAFLLEPEEPYDPGRSQAKVEQMIQDGVPLEQLTRIDGDVSEAVPNRKSEVDGKSVSQATDEGMGDVAKAAASVPVPVGEIPIDKAVKTDVLKPENTDSAESSTPAAASGLIQKTSRAVRYDSKGNRIE